MGVVDITMVPGVGIAMVPGVGIATTAGVAMAEGMTTAEYYDGPRVLTVRMRRGL